MAQSHAFLLFVVCKGLPSQRCKGLPALHVCDPCLCCGVQLPYYLWTFFTYLYFRIFTGEPVRWIKIMYTEKNNKRVIPSVSRWRRSTWKTVRLPNGPWHGGLYGRVSQAMSSSDRPYGLSWELLCLFLARVSFLCWFIRVPEWLSCFFVFQDLPSLYVHLYISIHKHIDAGHRARTRTYIIFMCKCLYVRLYFSLHSLSFLVALPFLLSSFFSLPLIYPSETRHPGRKKRKKRKIETPSLRKKKNGESRIGAITHFCPLASRSLLTPLPSTVNSP